MLNFMWKKYDKLLQNLLSQEYVSVNDQSEYGLHE